MKKMLAALLAAVLTLCFAAALAEGTGLADVKAKGTLVMGFDEEYPPMGFVDENGEYVGFDIDLAKEVTDRLGVELVLQPISWDSKELELSGKNIDCIWSGLTIDVLDPEAYTISVAYADNSQMILTKADSGIATLADLAGKVVGVQLGTSADILLQNEQKALADTFDGGEPVRFENYNVCFTELQAGSIDAIAIDYPVAAAKIAEYGDGYVMLDESIASEEYGICFRKDDAELCQQVEDAFMQLVENGTYVSLAEKYGLETSSLCLSK
mgnify:CR=1 FL=1